MEVDEIGKLVQLAVGAAKGAGRELPFDVHVLTDEELPTLVNAIVSVLPICTHRRTRRNLYSLLRQLFSQFSEFLPLMLSALKKEALRPVSMAISNRFLLLECTNEIATLACKDAIFKSYVGEIVVLQKILLPSCTRPEARQNLRISAQRHTRTALRCVFREDKIYVDNYMEELTRGSVLNIPLLDLVCGVVWRLQPRETYHACIERYQEKILELYVKEVVGSRSIVSPHLAGMPNFMSTFLTETALEQVVFPAVEKALLRAPEVLLEGILISLTSSVRKDIDLSSALRQFLRHLLSASKSTNPRIREQVVPTFVALIGHTYDEDTKREIAKEILEPLKAGKLTSPEQRIAHARLLSCVTPDIELALSLPSDLAAVSAKETNDAACAAVLHALFWFQSYALEHDISPREDVVQSIIKGLESAKPNVRKSWLEESTSAIWSNKSLPAAQILLEALSPMILKGFEEVIASPLQNPFVAFGYIALCLVESSLCFRNALTLSPKPSFLLWDRVYTKLSVSESVWAARALAGCSGHPLVTQDVGTAWGDTFLYITTSGNHEIRRATLPALEKAACRAPVLTRKLFKEAMWRHLTRGSPSNSSNFHHLFPILSRVQSETNNALVDFLVLSHAEPVRGNWIHLCQHFSVDPGHLCKDRIHDLFNEILLHSEGQVAPTVEDRAAFQAAATLAFVSPNVVNPLLVELISNDLSADDMDWIGPNEAGIWHTPEGTTYVDVLDKSAGRAIDDRKGKDYATTQWENEVRQQLRNKKGADQQLSKTEQNLVSQQLEEESRIRERVNTIAKRISRSLGMISTLAMGVSNGPEIWLPAACTCLLAEPVRKVSTLLGLPLMETFTACALQTSERIGVWREMTGVAILRTLGVPVSKGFEEEALGSLVTRILYRIRFVVDSGELDMVSFSFILPLLLAVIQRHGVSIGSASEGDEQSVLALEIISYQAETLGSVNHISRARILSTVLSAMERDLPNHKSYRDCLLSVGQSIGPTASESEKAEFMRALLSPEVSVRTAVLEIIDDFFELVDTDLLEPLRMSCFDDFEANADLAGAVWEENSLTVSEALLHNLVHYLAVEDQTLRHATAEALADAVGSLPSSFSKIFEMLAETYIDKAKPLFPEYDEFGMVIRSTVDRKDPWEHRSGIAYALLQMAPSFPKKNVAQLVDFLVKSEALGDRSEHVRREMVEAGVAIIRLRATDQVETLAPQLESFLASPDTGSDVADNVRVGVVILFGALACHLDPSDERLTQVLARLLATLNTPSESVQFAVSQCLPALISLNPTRARGYVETLFQRLFESPKYAGRRGAAYGLAGVVQGYGIKSLGQFSIMDQLQSAIDDRKEMKRRQGALFAYEMLSKLHGKLFEPYAIDVLPQLLATLGDPSADVREASDNVAKTFMRTISAYGVKMILPTLLGGLDESHWRSKKGSAELIGAMAYLAPRQLSMSLPMVIPRLTEILTDTHKEVRSAANQSLSRFGEVISNPEIQELVPTLLKALSDPTKYISSALDTLLKTSFVHYIDAPSLALVMYVLQRALRDRSAATKRKAAQIVGNMASLTDSRDLIPYLSTLVHLLKICLVDPVPTTRATAAQAFGTLIEKLGEDNFPDLVSSLLAVLKSDVSGVDRQGAAQGLSEILHGLGIERFEELLPTILMNTSSSKPYIREGFMSLLVFLPSSFGHVFGAYVGRVIQPILSGLADEMDAIRALSLTAGRMIVKSFATRAVDLLLPELEQGLAAASHRIRLSSVELVGDLLFQLAGISPKAQAEDGEIEEEELPAPNKGALSQLASQLGEERRDRVLASLYICRQDTSGLVKTAALDVWKSLVVNTPRTVKDIMPTMTSVILRRLASPNNEIRTIAARTLGEIISKNSEFALARLLPAIEEARTDGDSDVKQGICIAIAEIIEAANPDSVALHEKVLISTISRSLVDEDPAVRDAAAQAFDSLQQLLGNKAINQVLPGLLQLLQNPDSSENALAALRGIMSMRASTIFPVLVPKLTTQPMSTFNAKALAALSEAAAGPALHRRLQAIVVAFLDSIIQQDSEEIAELHAALDKVILAIDVEGLNTLMSCLLDLAKSDNWQYRANIYVQADRFFASTKLNFVDYAFEWVRILVRSFDDKHDEIVQAAMSALTSLTKSINKEELEELVVPTERVLRDTGTSGKEIRAFLLPKGVNSTLPIFLQGVMYGTSEQREAAAVGLSHIVDKTSPEGLRPYVTQITGPLIRTLGERYNADVKAAILHTLDALLLKIPLFLKAFLPQLQRTFAKCLADPTSSLLRARAASALGTLITLQTRIDPLIGELVVGAKTAEEKVQIAMLSAIYEVVGKAGGNMSDQSKASLFSMVKYMLRNGTNPPQVAMVCGVLFPLLSVNERTRFLEEYILVKPPTFSAALAVNAVIRDGAASLQEAKQITQVLDYACNGLEANEPAISDNCATALGKLLLAQVSLSFDQSKHVLASLERALHQPPSGSTDTKRLSLVVVDVVARERYDLIRPHIKSLASAVFACVRDIIVPVKLAAEQTFISIFKIDSDDGTIFEKFVASLAAPEGKSMNDYKNRVAVKLAAARRERQEAGAELDDDRDEIMAIGV